MAVINLHGGVSLEPAGQFAKVYIVRGHDGTYGDPVRWAATLEIFGAYARVSGLNLMDAGSSGRFTTADAAALRSWLREYDIKQVEYQRLVNGRMQTHVMEI
ncbi:hypothetical protein ABO04_04935 [Nitrosomonas sp. HPC101]|uniref:hypothetical protein n=1 Tax=Nitrosomonas sp. HPC101 TaxID=1658667 RepID=UPI00136DC069|nr:hypothetical protein [Nitrosomonas sp. HPC101]MXS85279.1 hypothetical protein [Nitrosomonas sp. HPC101]